MTTTGLLTMLAMVAGLACSRTAPIRAEQPLADVSHVDAAATAGQAGGGSSSSRSAAPSDESRWFGPTAAHAPDASAEWKPAPTLPPPRRPGGSGWQCFGWVMHRYGGCPEGGWLVGDDCYRTKGECTVGWRKWWGGNKTPCAPKTTAFCLTTEALADCGPAGNPSCHSGTRCFGDEAYCINHQMRVSGKARYSRCERFE